MVAFKFRRDRKKNAGLEPGVFVTHEKFSATKKQSWFDRIQIDAK